MSNKNTPIQRKSKDNNVIKFSLNKAIFFVLKIVFRQIPKFVEI